MHTGKLAEVDTRPTSMLVGTPLGHTLGQVCSFLHVCAISGRIKKLSHKLCWLEVFLGHAGECASDLEINEGTHNTISSKKLLLATRVLVRI